MAVNFDKTSAVAYARANNLSVKEAKDKLFADDDYANIKQQRKPGHFVARRWPWVAPGKMFHTDLVHLSKDVVSGAKNPMRFLLTIIDVGSRWASFIEMNSKTATVVAEKLRLLLKTFPGTIAEGAVIVSDSGNEFLGKPTQTMLAELGLCHEETHGEHGAAIVERFHGTLRRLNAFYRAATPKPVAYVKGLKTIVLPAYNNKHHSYLGMSPNEALAMPVEELEHIVNELHPIVNIKPDKPAKFNVGDIVRLRRTKNMFQKADSAKGGIWTGNMKIVKVYHTQKMWMYRVELDDGETSRDSFYEWEIQKLL